MLVQTLQQLGLYAVLLFPVALVLALLGASPWVIVAAAFVLLALVFGLPALRGGRGGPPR